MLRIDPSNPVPIWKQIEDGVLRLVAGGTLRPGDALDSVREAARLLGVNPLTVSRAYRALADQGVLTVRRGEGTFVALAPPTLKLADQRDRLLTAARSFVGRARSLGADRSASLDAVREAWGAASSSSNPSEASSSEDPNNV